MKKRLLSLLMCALIVLSSFIMAACSDDEGELEKLGGESDEMTTTSKNDAMTICIYSIRGKGTTDEAIELVEQELSRIAVRKYNTKIDLILIDEEDYAAMMFTKIRMAIASYNTALIKDITTLTPEQITEIRNSNVDYRDESGVSYGIREETNLSSDVLNGTLDIFLCYTPVNEYGEADNTLLYDSVPDPDKTYSMFEILYREKALAPLKSYLNGFYSDLKSVLYTHSLSYVERFTYDTNKSRAEADDKDITPYYGLANQYTGTKGASNSEYYGVPNNYIYGSYDYIIFNENYVNKFISPNGMGVDKTDYIPTTGNEANINRFNTLVSELQADKAANPDAWENVYLTDADGNIPSFDSYESFESFVNGDGYDFDGDGVLEMDYNNFAIARISGNASVKELLSADRFENFDVYTEKYNKVEKSSDYCDSMYCIGLNAMGADQKGERIKRSLDILRLINTNVEFRNTLQYGVEGVHYSQYSEDEDVNPLNGAKAEEKYTNLNPKYFGNMFLLYPNSEMTASEKLMAKNKWQMAKDQILELVLSSYKPKG